MFDENGRHFIFRAWFRLPDGTIVRAKDRGRRAFKIYVDGVD